MYVNSGRIREIIHEGLLDAPKNIVFAFRRRLPSKFGGYSDEHKKQLDDMEEIMKKSENDPKYFAKEMLRLTQLKDPWLYRIRWSDDTAPKNSYNDKLAAAYDFIKQDPMNRDATPDYRNRKIKAVSKAWVDMNKNRSINIDMIDDSRSDKAFMAYLQSSIKSKSNKPAMSKDKLDKYKRDTSPTAKYDKTIRMPLGTLAQRYASNIEYK